MLCIRVDEVASVLVVCIQDLESGFFVAFAETFFPASVLVAICIWGVHVYM